MSIRDDKAIYAQVFETLCKYANIQCVIVSGHAKDVHYDPGMKFTKESHRHTWNAVQIQGDWYLIDPAWGARYIIWHLSIFYTKHTSQTHFAKMTFHQSLYAK